MSEHTEGSLLGSLQLSFGKSEGDSGEFLVELPHGHQIRCRKVTDAKELRTLRRAAQKYGETQAARPTSAAPSAWQPYHVADAELYAHVYLLSRLCIEPDFHGNELNCLILSRQCGPIFEHLLQQINLASVNLEEKAAREIEAEEKV